MRTSKIFAESASLLLRTRPRLPALAPSSGRCLATQADVSVGGPLAGIRVLEMGHLIAAPHCGFLLGYYGAEVIKVEAPGKGDPLRVWREVDEDGVSPWFRSLARNKKSVTIDLRQEKGRELVRKLALQSDVLLENFKPGTIERWGLGPADLHPHKPDLIFTRVSGYGQTGPMRSVGGYAAVCEAFSGFRYVNGHVDKDGKMLGAPVRPNISLGDTLAGLNACLGTVMALLARQKLGNNGKTGQLVDVAIYESVMGMLEGMIPAYDRFGVIRGPSGSGVTGIVPTNAYPTKGDTPTYIIIGGNGDSIFARLCGAMGRSDLLQYKTNIDRVKNQQVIEDGITAWTSSLTADEALKALAEAEVPSGRINNVEDLVNNEQVQARGMVETIKVDSKKLGKSWDLRVPGSSPVLESRRAEHRAGPDLGADNEEIFSSMLGLSEADQQSLRAEGVI